MFREKGVEVIHLDMIMVSLAAMELEEILEFLTPYSFDVDECLCQSQS